MAVPAAPSQWTETNFVRSTGRARKTGQLVLFCSYAFLFFHSGQFPFPLPSILLSLSLPPSTTPAALLSRSLGPKHRTIHQTGIKAPSCNFFSGNMFIYEVIIYFFNFARASLRIIGINDNFATDSSTTSMQNMS